MSAGRRQRPLAGILLEAGFLLLTKIRDNFFRARSGVTFAAKSDADDGAASPSGVFTASAICCNAATTGIRLGGSSYYTSDTVLARNFIVGTGVAGISVTGFAFPELEITGNTITPQKGDGIVVGTGGVRIADNRVVELGGEAQNGIRLVQVLTRARARSDRRERKSPTGFAGERVTIETAARLRRIRAQRLERDLRQRPVMLPGSAAGSVTFWETELINIANGAAGATKVGEFAAIHLRNVLAGAISETQSAVSAMTLPSPR